MTTVLGMVGLNNDDFLRVGQVDYNILQDAVRAYVDNAVDAMQDSMSIFVEEVTTEYQEKMQLPMTGEMSQTVSGAEVPPVTVLGDWTVAYPLYEFSEGLVATAVDYAYLTPAAFDKHINGLLSRYSSRVQKEILRAIFDDTAMTFNDPYRGNLTIEALANTDGTLYPPDITGEDPTERQAYIAAGYTTLSTVNNPFPAMRTYYSNIYGTPANNDVIAFIHSDEVSGLQSISGFTEVRPEFTQLSDAQEYALANKFLPGEILGRVNGVLVSRWDYIPSGYIVGLHTAPGVAAPVKMRVDPADTGLGGGRLQFLEAPTSHTKAFNYWRARFGMGVFNRLNGYIVQLTLGSYTVPSAYDRTA